MPDLPTLLERLSRARGYLEESRNLLGRLEYWNDQMWVYAIGQALTGLIERLEKQQARRKGRP